MASPQEKLAQSLEVLAELGARGITAIQSKEISRTHRERLVANGFLQEVMKGWYLRTDPNEKRGESAAWYMAFWDFCRAYLTVRFGDAWCLSPEQSLCIHSGNLSVPPQLLVRAPGARNNATQLIHDTSLFETRASLPDSNQVDQIDGLRVFPLPVALLECAPRYYQQNPTDVRAALTSISDTSELLTLLLNGGHSVVAGRLSGAFRNIGRDRIADEIIQSMKAAGYDVRESDPFKDRPASTLLSSRVQSPYVVRIQLLWDKMRDPVRTVFPEAPGIPSDTKSYLDTLNDIFVRDAFHSLSIEGYRVTPELIEQVRKRGWNLDDNQEDDSVRNALAAKGYDLAFKSVNKSLERVLAGDNAGTVALDDHGTWYRELISPSVTAGLTRPSELAGYRNGPVYIRQSRHAPPKKEAVRDCMPALFELISHESEPSVRAVLGHFVFVYVHPYMDGNGRIGRFLMNVMLGSGGYPWTVVPYERRTEYMTALEAASVDQNIEPFAKFIAELVKDGM